MRWIALMLTVLLTGCHITHVRVKVVCVQPVTGSLEVETFCVKETDHGKR